MAPQSLSMQSQAASQYCLFAVVWVSMMYLSRNELGVRFRASYTLLLVAASALLLMYPTTTIWIVGILLLMSIMFLSPFRRGVALRLAVLAGVVLTATALYAVLSAKIVGETWRAIAVREAFANPLYVFPNLSTFDKAWGTGGIGQASASVRDAVSGGDFGMAIAAIESGLVLWSAAVGAIVLITLRMWRLSYDRSLHAHPYFAWVWLGYVNAVLVIGNVLSTVHYTVSLQAGGRALFSFHIAVTLIAFERLASRRRALATTFAAA